MVKNEQEWWFFDENDPNFCPGRRTPILGHFGPKKAPKRPKRPENWVLPKNRHPTKNWPPKKDRKWVKMDRNWPPPGGGPPRRGQNEVQKRRPKRGSWYTLYSEPSRTHFEKQAIFWPKIDRIWLKMGVQKRSAAPPLGQNFWSGGLGPFFLIVFFPPFIHMHAKIYIRARSVFRTEGKTLYKMRSF